MSHWIYVRLQPQDKEVTYASVALRPKKKPAPRPPSDVDPVYSGVRPNAAAEAESSCTWARGCTCRNHVQNPVERSGSSPLPQRKGCQLVRSRHGNESSTLGYGTGEEIQSVHVFIVIPLPLSKASPLSLFCFWLGHNLSGNQWVTGNLDASILQTWWLEDRRSMEQRSILSSL